jgi:hypothetical protein
VPPGGAATYTRILGKLLAAALGRSAGRYRSYETDAERLCDATPMKSPATQ